MRLGIGLILGLTGTDALSCYTCTHRENSYGRTLEGKASCKTQNNAEDILECLDGEVCNTFVENLWPPNGPQQFAISRGCGARVDDCLVFTDPNERHVQRQACSKSCEGDNCNTFDTIDEVINQLPQAENPVETCTTCSYETVEGLPVRGNATCQFGGGVQGEEGDDFEKQCPIHSKHGCYDTQATWIDADGMTHKQTHRGCSAFKLEEEDCYKQIRANGLSYAICKDTCDATEAVENCNSHPLGEIPDLQTDLTLCQVCHVAVDQNNNTLGFGDAGCWAGDAKFIEDCNADNPNSINPYDMCVTELMTDWDQSGAHLYQVIRKCGRRNNDYDTCNEAESSLIEFKDCTKICNPAQNAGCNTGLQAVSMLFYQGNVQSCYQCSFYQQSNGDFVGQEACAAEIDALNSNNIPTHQCPLYATGSCYTASSTHKDYNDAEGNSYIQEEFRGCTPFEQKDKCYQTTVELEGVKIDHEHCKHTCESNNCNIERHQKRRKCHVCQSIRDSSGVPQGTGTDDCWNSDALAESDDFSAECPYDHPYCLEEVTTEWFAGGQQIAIMKRGCSKTPAKATCDAGSSGVNGSRFMYKDCAKHCENDSGDNCNVNLGIEELFSGNQDKCKTCYDIVNPDGSVSGNERCAENPVVSKNCNFYAKEGCFTSISAHIVDGKQRDDSYRGCSAFKMPGDDNEFTCYNSQISSGNGLDTYNVCKATCAGRDCNTAYKNPLEESPVSSCLVCSVTVDANNNTVGVGQAGCWEGDSEYLQACPTGQNHCITDMEVDWMARGNMQYRVRRGCAATPVSETQPCFSGSTSIIMYKDCSITCPTNTGSANGCNTGLDAVAAKFAPDLEAGENMVGSCKTCEFFQNQDGSVTGNKACKDDMVWVDSKKCPIYASHACFEASSFHRSYGSDQDTFTIEDDYRGCSPFVKQTDPDAEPECSVMELNGLTHTNCKKTCLTDNCNTDRLQNRQTCYACTATRDSQGWPIGVGDDHCFDNPAAETLTDCSNGDEYCKDEMIIDWLPRGDQITRIVRGCSSYPAPGPCSEGQSSSSMFKDCYHSCWESGCNNDMSVALKFNPSGSSSNLVNTCQTCIYAEQDNGDIKGNEVCKDQEMHKRFAKSCPLYARTACFTSNAVHYNQLDDHENELVMELRKGCSAFRLDGDLKTYDIQLDTGDNSQMAFSVAKTTCKNDDIAYLEFGCNYEYTDPIGLPAINTCQVCQVTVDQQNNTIGIGDRGCWEGSNDYNQQCNIGEYCVTDLEVDWMSRGLMQYRVRRGCSTTPPNVVQECFEGRTPYIQFKDCQITCDGNINPGCNGGLDAVAYKFDAGVNRTDSCHTCVYTQSPSGDVSGQERCGESLLENNSVGGPKIRSQSCPMYANTGCYQASSTHDDFNNPANSFVDDYRGCSTFEHPIANKAEDSLHCETTKTDGLTHVNCKSTCSGTDCNKARLVPGNSCYSCTVTLDSNFNVFGLGDRKCWFSVEEEHVAVCDEDQPYCVDELQVDWFGRGQQLSTIIRGCRKNPPASDTCAEGANASFKYKDCQHACKNGNAEGGKNGCNNDLYSVARKFRPDPEHPVTEGHYQSSCFACHYTERDDGKVDGNYHCFDAEAENGTFVPLIPCPLHASAACYTGSSSHDTDGGIRKNEVYKGCSTFVIDSGVEANEELLPIPGGQAYYKMVKQTCLSGACNSGTLHPDDILPDVTTPGATPTTKPGDTPTTKPGETPPADGTTVAPPATTGNTPTSTESQPDPTTGASTTAQMTTVSSSDQTTGAPIQTTTEDDSSSSLLVATVSMICLMLIL